MNLQLCATLLALTGCVLLSPSSLPAAEDEPSSSSGKVEVGYRAVSTDGNPDRAAEYSFLDPSPTFGLDLRGGTGGQHFIFEGKFLNENDYRAEAHLDHYGLASLNLRTERFFHNLDHIPYAPGAPEARGDADGQADAFDPFAAAQFHEPRGVPPVAVVLGGPPHGLEVGSPAGVEPVRLEPQLGVAEEEERKVRNEASHGRSTARKTLGWRALASFWQVHRD